jgi:hypothetical protein
MFASGAGRGGVAADVLVGGLDAWRALAALAVRWPRLRFEPLPS